MLAGPSPRASVTTAIEESPRNPRQCPHGQCETSVSRGQANGLRRFCCTACGKTVNALTGTPLARLRKKELWLNFGEALSEGGTVKERAERCGVAPSTTFRWRHRVLRAAKAEARDCQEFRVWSGIMGTKEYPDAAVERPKSAASPTNRRPSWSPSIAAEPP
jgi:transposase-like protein